MCSEEVGAGEGGSARLPRPSYNVGRNSRTRPPTQKGAQMVWHGHRPKSRHRVLEAPVGPTSQALDWLGQGAPLGSRQIPIHVEVPSILIICGSCICLLTKISVTPNPYSANFKVIHGHTQSHKKFESPDTRVLR